MEYSKCNGFATFVLLCMVVVCFQHALSDPISNLNNLDMNQMNDYALNHETNERKPSFVTPGQTYRIVAGATVVLPCRVSEPGNYILVWKRGIAVLTAGAMKVTPDPRVRLLSTPQPSSPLPGLSGGGYSLELRDVRPQDAGDYVCQIGTMEPIEITHTLEILVPPRIHHVSHTGRVELSQGATVKLECRASGNPVPTIAWTRKNNVLPNGERQVTGLTLLLQHVDRHAAGQYVCSADNGVAQPDQRIINLVVKFPPEVETERSYVHTGIGLEAQLVCIVHAEPAPQVIWYKETAQIGTTEKHATQYRGNRHTLFIRNVSAGDFGNYTCQASNNQGKARGHITLTGTAAMAVFESSALGDSTHSYNLTWSVASYSPITEFRLFFRPQPQPMDNLHHKPIYHQSDLQMNNIVPKLDNGTNVGSYYHNTGIYGSGTSNSGSGVMGSGSSASIGIITSGGTSTLLRTNSITNNKDWSSVILPGPSVYTGSVAYPSLTRQYMSYVIRGLQPATHYEARVQAKNAHGWNRISPVFHFTTRAEDIEPVVEQSVQTVFGLSPNTDSGMQAYNRATTKSLVLLTQLSNNTHNRILISIIFYILYFT